MNFVASRLRSSILPRSFYNRDPREVAPDLLGKIVVRVIGRATLAGRIVETEAYLGTDDAAAHAAAGKTARNAVLFGPPGHAYVYFIYGNHYCLNASCMPEGDAGCVLIRALEPLSGIEAMARNRGIPHPAQNRGRMGRPQAGLRLLTSGPGRLCEALGITRPKHNGADLTSSASGLYIADEGFRPEHVATTVRIGITKAAAHPLRFFITGNPFVSGRKR